MTTEPEAPPLSPEEIAQLADDLPRVIQPERVMLRLLATIAALQVNQRTCICTDDELCSYHYTKFVAPMQDAVDDVLARAWKFDDKPHQLFNGIRLLAEKYADAEMRDEIMRLMDEEYCKPPRWVVEGELKEERALRVDLESKLREAEGENTRLRARLIDLCGVAALQDAKEHEEPK